MLSIMCPAFGLPVLFTHMSAIVSAISLSRGPCCPVTRMTVTGYLGRCRPQPLALQKDTCVQVCESPVGPAVCEAVLLPVSFPVLRRFELASSGPSPGYTFLSFCGLKVSL